MKTVASFLLIALFSISCANLQTAHKYELGNGTYRFRQDGTPYVKTDIFILQDSVRIFRDVSNNEEIIPDPHKSQIYLKKSFDLDVMTIAFKYRPARPLLPRQLTTDFNGNMFLGYRYDRFKIKLNQTPLGIHRTYHHRGFTLGGFGGLGSSSITPWTTSSLITDEYNGFILSRGFAAMMGVNNLTVGFGLGWDYLTDRDKEIWIYQNKPWYGVTVGLNLN